MKKTLMKINCFMVKDGFSINTKHGKCTNGIFSMHLDKRQSNAPISFYIWKVQQKSCNYFKPEFHKSILVAEIDNQSCSILGIEILCLRDPTFTEFLLCLFSSFLKRKKQLMLCQYSYAIYSKYYSTLVYIYF